MKNQKSVVSWIIFFVSVIIILCYFLLNTNAQINDFHPSKYSSSFWIDKAWFYYVDFDNNTKIYYPQFDSSKVKILNEKFFVYKNKELYSNYNIEKLLWDNSINKVYEGINPKKLKFLNDSYLYDDKNIYPNVVALKDWKFDIENNMLVKDKKMYCFNKNSFDIVNLDDFDIKRKWNISLFKSKMLGDYSLFLWCKRFSPESVTSLDTPFFEIKNDSIISEIKQIWDKYIKIKENIYIDSSYEPPFWPSIFVDKNTFKYLKWNYYRDSENVYYISTPLYDIDVNNLKFITDDIVSDGKTSYYKYWKIWFPKLGIEELWKYFFKNGNDIYFRNYLSNNNKLSGIDSKNYEVLSNWIIKDFQNVYYLDIKMPLNPTKLRIFNSWYYWDEKRIFYWNTEIVWADASTFKTFKITKGIAKDKKNFYYWSIKLNSVDVGSFEVLNYFFWKDKYNLYLLWWLVDKIEKIKEWKDIKVISNVAIEYDGNIYEAWIWSWIYKNGIYMPTESVK